MPPDMAAAATASLVSFAATSSSASAIPSVNHDSMMKFSHVAMTYQATLLGVIIWVSGEGVARLMNMVVSRFRKTTHHYHLHYSCVLKSFVFGQS